MNIPVAIFMRAFAISLDSAQCPLPTIYPWTDGGVLSTPRQSQDLFRGVHARAVRGQAPCLCLLGQYPREYRRLGLLTLLRMDRHGLGRTNPDEDGVVAPKLFLFKPKNIWALAHQVRRTDDPLLYKLSPDPTDANAWSDALTLWEHRAPSFLTNHALIGDDTTMHLFWIDYEYNQIFRSSMPIDHFPFTFTYREFVHLGFQDSLRLGGAQVYTMKGMNQCLMIVEVQGSIGHSYRSFVEASLDGSWTPQATSERYPFAGEANSGARRTNHISRADLIRSNPDQTFTIDTCSLQLVYRGNDLALLHAGMQGYRPGLLTTNATFASSHPPHPPPLPSLLPL
jgi:hypothetical protein